MKNIIKNFTFYLSCMFVLSTVSTINTHAQEITVTRNGNLRSGPGTTYEIIGNVTTGMKVIQLKMANDWFKIKLSDQKEGWIHSILITKKETNNFITLEIHKAAKENDVQKMREIISNGANINARDEQRRTALHWAAVNGYNDLAKILLNAGADVNVKDKWSGGNTPIEYTVFSVTDWNKNMSQYGRYGMGNEKLWNNELFYIFLEHDAQVQPERQLLKAVPSNDIQLLDFIINNWNISAPKNDERYVYSAVVRGAHESLKWLIEKGAEINKPQEDPNNFTPLHIAAMHRDKKAIEILLKAGAYKSFGVEDKYGRKPAYFAKREGIYDMFGAYLPENTRLELLKEIKNNNCFQIEEFGSNELKNWNSRVYVKNGNYTVFRSIYNTTEIQITGNEGGLEADGGLPGGMAENNVFCFINESIINLPGGQKFIFEGDSNDPLTFLLTNNQGLIYCEGKGKVTINDSRSVTLPCVKQ